MSQKKSQSLWGLLVAQFFGAFNDNAWKIIVALSAIRIVKAKGLDEAAFEAMSQSQTTIAFAVFTLPLLLFSMPAGTLSDRFSKRLVIIILKAVEIILMGLATFSLYVKPAGGIEAFVILGLMGLQSAFFSPAKYGILPEIVPHERLSAGNGALEMWTFLAIIGGTACGGFFLDSAGEKTWLVGALLMVFSVIGFLASFAIPKISVAKTEGSMSEGIIEAWKAIRADRVLTLTVVGSAFYWMIASIIGQDVLVYAKSITQNFPHSDTFSGLPMAGFGIGVGIGSVLAGKISGNKVEYGLIPLGAIGLSILTLIFGILGPNLSWTCFIMALMGLASGLIVVPLDSIIQWRSPAGRRGAIIAITNVFVFGGILIGSLGTQALSMAGLSSMAILIASSLLTVSGTLWALFLLPDALVRLILVLLTRTFYRLKVIGVENIPQTGGVLLAPNHVSFIDGFLVTASIDRPVRFIVDEFYYNHPLLKPLMKAMQVIPVSANGGIRVVLKALRDAGRFLDEGEVVCIFPEGQVTRTGMLMPFRRGLERIAKGRNAPIVPMYLDRIWGSIFSRSGGRFITKLPEQVPYPVTIAFGPPLPSETPINEIRKAVQNLGELAWAERKSEQEPLHRPFIRKMRQRPWRFLLADVNFPEFSRFRALIGSISFARALQKGWKDQEFVGILLPPSVAGVLVNIACSLSGRVSVNLNYTSGKSGMESAAKQARLRTIVTSRSFIEKAKLEFPEGVEPIWIEEVAEKIGAGEKIISFLLGVFAPLGWIEHFCTERSSADRYSERGFATQTWVEHFRGNLGPFSPDNLATVIFSSGSTGEPKGVMLSHYNVGSNMESVGQVLQLEQSDRMLGVLPLFHSFGYMSTWFFLSRGMSIVFHPNPLDAAKVGELAEKYSVTFFIATPTFLQIYMRRCQPEQLGTLRMVLTGAEKLSERLALAFEEKFGLKPVEGYGATECSPAITLSTLDFRGKGIYQAGSHRGYVGHPVPGIAVRVVDPETSQPLPPGRPGMLLVRGPNVMRGYLGRDDLTAKAIKDGWYVTGDIAIIDDNGFVKITDRLSRFSKIGGEMVPHGKVEEALHVAADANTQTFAVTAVPDERKGEKLAVLHISQEDKIPEIIEKLAASGLPNLFIPRRENFIKVEKIPLLGTGKIDLKALKTIAASALISGNLATEPAKKEKEEPSGTVREPNEILPSVQPTEDRESPKETNEKS